MNRLFLPAVALVSALTASVPATAAYVISGTRINIAPGTVPGQGRCVPPYFSTTVFTPGHFISGGSTNFGDYQLSASHCNLGPGPRDYVDGIGDLIFDDGDVLSGVYTGTVVPSGMPGIVVSTSQWVITGGTGRFYQASGFMTHTGTLRVIDYQGVRSGFYDATIEGLLNLPAVPEPAVWGLMIAGFGLVGAAVRNRRNGPAIARHSA